MEVSQGVARPNFHVAGPYGSRRPAFRITLCAVKETIGGVPVTQEQIQAWADEAERGYDVEELRRRGRKPIGDGPAKVVPVRLDDTTLAAVDERARQDHVTRSEAIRAAIRAYVA